MTSETTQKIFLDDRDTAFFECPRCHVTKEADITKYKKIESSITLKVKCPCGNIYSVILERRKYYRKGVKLPCKFRFPPHTGDGQKGLMTIIDISKGGLRLKMGVTPLFKKGDILELEFILDNKNNTQITKQVFVRNIKGNYVNVEFCSFDAADSGDKAIGFYLF